MNKALISSMMAISMTMKLMVLAALIFLGSSSYALLALKHAREEKREFGVVDGLTAFTVAAFSGLIFFLTAAMTSDHWVVAWLSGGIGSFMGLTGISKLADAVIEFLTSRVKDK